MGVSFDDLHIDDGGRDNGSTSQRGRLVAGVVAAMLVAVAGGVGYGIGRNIDDGSGGTTAGAETSDAQSFPDETVTETTPAPPAPSATDLTSMDESTGSGSASVSMGSSGGSGYAAFGSQPQETLFERTTDDGFTVRAQLGELWGPDGFLADGPSGPNGFRPAPWCFPTGQIRVALAGNGVIDVGGAPWYTEPFRGRAVTWMLLGGSDSAPQWVIVVQTPADTTTVRVDFADGSSDSTAPQNAVAVLVAPGELPTDMSMGDSSSWMDPMPEFTVTLEGGTEPGTVAAASERDLWDDPEYVASCEPPPPALPDAGEQPADPAMAEAEIRAAMTALYGAIGAGEIRGDLIDDPTGVAGAREQVEAGGYASSAATASATIDELVFTTPVEAWFRYSIETGGNDFRDRYGIGVLIDGSWKISRSTVCQDLSLAGGDCGGDWSSVEPPSMREYYEQYDQSVAPASTTQLGD